MPDRRPPPAALLALAAVIALGLWVRCAGFRNVFPSTGVQLKPTDSQYYVRFAALQLESFPRFRDFDPLVNHPEGARILWPAGHTWLVAATLSFFEPARHEEAAAWVDPLLYVTWSLLFAWLALAVLGWRPALGAMAILAFTNAAVQVGELGNADHHVHEPFLVATLLLLQIAAIARGSTVASVGAGVLMGAGRMLTTSAFAFVPGLALALVLAAATDRERALNVRRVALLEAGAGALSAFLCAVVLGHWRSLSHELPSSFLAVLIGCAFLLAASVASLRLGRRSQAVGLALGAGGAGAMLIPEVLRAARALLGADPLLELAAESQSLAHYPAWAASLLGAVLFVLPLCVYGFVGRLRKELPAIASVAVGLPLLIATVAQVRFAPALCGALAVFVPLGLLPLLDEPRRALSRACKGVVLLAAASWLPSLVPQRRDPTPTDEALLRPTLRWLREHTPEERVPGRPDYGVVASQDFGHLVTLWGQRAAVATPFSQAPWHVAGNLRAARVLASESDDEAYSRAVQTGARYVIVTPFQRILGHPLADDRHTLARRLLESAATGEDGLEATAHFRLVHDSAEQRLRAQKGPFARVFEVVAGGVLVGTAEPNAEVSAKLTLRTAPGTVLQYRRVARADPTGAFTLRVAYPSSKSEEMSPQGPYRVESGGRWGLVEIDEDAVRAGRPVRVDLAQPEAGHPP